MESSNNEEILYDCRFFKAYKDGRVHVHRFRPTVKVPPSDDSPTGVRSKDVIISPETGVSARIFLPKDTNPGQKLPLLFYIHGGGFCMFSPFSPQYHDYLNLVVAQANIIAISVDYGLYPERPIPACYEDSWDALKWVASHASGDGPDQWLNDHADFNRVFIAGDSAGGNISHTLAVRVGSIGLPGVKVVGAVLFHPYFGGTPDDEMWLYMCPTNKGLNDPRLKPAPEDLAKLGCERVLVFAAEKDHLFEMGKSYYEELKKSGWKGKAEIVENKGEEHCFHLHDLKYEKAQEMLERFVSFIKQD